MKSIKLLIDHIDGDITYLKDTIIQVSDSTYDWLQASYEGVRNEIKEDMAQVIAIEEFIEQEIKEDVIKFKEALTIGTYIK